MGPNRDGDKQVSGRSAVFTGVALSPDGNGLSVVDTGGNTGLNGLAVPWQSLQG